MATTDSAPETAEALREEIIARYDTLSKRLQQVARYVLDQPNALALETLAVLAQRAGVQPSTIVRFAKAFGYEGAAQMQRLFRNGLISGDSAISYRERVREFAENVDNRRVGGPNQVLSEFVHGNVLALQNLEKSLDPRDLAAAVDMIGRADSVYVAGFRRSFPVAAYLAYSLHQVDKKTVFIDSVGGMTRQQIHAISKRDLLLVISYQPYAEEAVHLIDAAVEAGAKVLSISDSLVSPVAKPSTLVLQVHEAEIRKFRSLSASMCLAQSLVIGYAFKQTRAPKRNGSTLGIR